MLSLLLATRFRRPWPILAGVLVATLANHALAGVVGVLIGHQLRAAILDAAVGVSTVALAAGYSNLYAVVAGTTCGMLVANAPMIFLGNAFAGRLPMRAIHYTTTIANEIGPPR